eukprot:TRINITY_DN33206_c0_g1_i1.p1 TRINITY_DN33206_c0_g1~~TRINITY_DN33206_c0_g1_i1.p1  ORF type:complete len:100 (+),score=21.88 TRINITY_DN33206_c0_g1_i1:3-302(+)
MNLFTETVSGDPTKKQCAVNSVFCDLARCRIRFLCPECGNKQTEVKDWPMLGRRVFTLHDSYVLILEVACRLSSHKVLTIFPGILRQDSLQFCPRRASV